MQISRWAFPILILTLLYTNGATAITFNTFTDLTTFEAAAGPLTLEDFAGEPNAPLFNKDLGDFSLRLDNSAAPPNAPFGGTFSIFQEQLLLQGCCYWSVTTLTFDNAITALGFDWSNGDNLDYIELLADGQSFQFGPPGQQGFFGIVATDGAFTVAGLSDTFGGGGQLSWGLIDNIRYSDPLAADVPVSVPGAGWLVVLAFGVMSYFGSRKAAS